MHSPNQSIRPLIQRKPTGSEFLVSQKSTSPTQRALPVGSRPTTSKLTGSSSGAQITRSIVRAFFAPFTFLLWWTRQRCHGLLVTALIGPIGGETLEAWGCAYNTSFYVVSTGVRINTLVPNNTKMAREGARAVWFSVGSDVSLSSSRWGDSGRRLCLVLPSQSVGTRYATEPPFAIIPFRFWNATIVLSIHRVARAVICRIESGFSSRFIRNYPFTHGCFMCVRRGFNCNIPFTEIWTHTFMILNIAMIN